MKDLTLLSFSDIHIGNNRVPASKIISEFNYSLDQLENKSDIDIIFIAGDVFDSKLSFPSLTIPTQSRNSNHVFDTSEIIVWVFQLLNFCYYHNIKLRVLEGTNSHDRKQSIIFETLNKLRENPIDLKYFSQMDVEYITEYDCYVLYIPDEYSTDATITFRDAITLMKNKYGIDQVDIAVMHGMFNYQLPKKALVNKSVLNEESFLSIVRYFIFIGHIHLHTVYKNIIAQGSFSRISQGEEDPKGFIKASIIDNAGSYVFIENKKATKFITLKINKKDTLDIGINKIDKLAQKIPPYSHIRISCNKDHPLYINFNEIKRMFPTVWLTRDNDELSVNSESETVFNIPIIDLETHEIIINDNNIKGIIRDRINKRTVMSDYQSRYFDSLFQS